MNQEELTKIMVKHEKMVKRRRRRGARVAPRCELERWT